MMTVTVELGERSYPIYIGRDLLDRSDLLNAHVPGSQVMVVSNDVVAPLYVSRVIAALGNRQVDVFELEDGEQHKTLERFAQVIDRLAEKGHHRTTTVLALGGGVVGDMAGFAAASYQRGVNFVQVPTTLLAQVDSSVGGKTAVNLAAGKNLVGAFYQPSAVLADLGVLATLPDRELRAGLAEVLKYGVIEDAVLFDYIEANAAALLARDDDALSHVIRRSCEIKAEVVADDEREHGRRAILNFGHTFGHAIERCAGYGLLLHGEAVAIGMLMASDLSARMGLLEPAAAQRVRRVVEALDLPTACPPEIPVDDLMSAFRMDKKVVDGTVRFVLAREIGEVFVTEAIDPDALTSTLNSQTLCGANG